jgi:hypothetical protein
MDELGVGRGLAQGDGQKGNSLQVEDLRPWISFIITRISGFGIPHRDECSSLVALLVQHV